MRPGKVENEENFIPLSRAYLLLKEIIRLFLYK